MRMLDAVGPRTDDDLRREEYLPISAYGLIGNGLTSSLVSRDGSIDWACFPRFDSPSVFCRILDSKKGGHFQIHPEGNFDSSRKYIPETAVLKTSFHTPSGDVELIDFMPITQESAEADQYPSVVRIVNCTRGRVDMLLDLQPRFEYGNFTPRLEFADSATCEFSHERQRLILKSTIDLSPPDCEGLISKFSLASGQSACVELYSFVHATDSKIAFNFDATKLLNEAVRHWGEWASKCSYRGAYRDEVLRSALTLKLLTYEPTGAIIAAPTTSLPEEIGGVRNWDYRFTWLRDATFMVDALYAAGFGGDAGRFVDWLCEYAKACNGELQIAYGVAGEKEAPERKLCHLEGYRCSQPVRVGNHAFTQFQLDTFGELLSCIDSCRQHGHDLETEQWEFFRLLVDQVCERWREPDQGIWEVRSGPKHFVHSKVMAWVAVHRATLAAEQMGFEADLPRWKSTSKEIYDEVMQKGWDDKIGCFIQAYDSPILDAANLRLPLVGFMSATHPKMKATIERTEQLLTKDGLVYRYLDADDGLPGGEATFAICTFWLVQNLIALGEHKKAQKYLDHVLSFGNDLGLFAEEIEPTTREQLGNFPQGFTHVGLINAAVQLNRSLEDQALRLTH